jgi:hypothetical protein
MVEYGHGVSQGTGGGGAGRGGGGSLDAGAELGRMFNDAVYTVSTLPPETLLLLFVGIVVGLFVLKRAF